MQNAHRNIANIGNEEQNHDFEGAEFQNSTHEDIGGPETFQNNENEMVCEHDKASRQQMLRNLLDSIQDLNSLSCNIQSTLHNHRQNDIYGDEQIELKEIRCTGDSNPAAPSKSASTCSLRCRVCLLGPNELGEYIKNIKFMYL